MLHCRSVVSLARLPHALCESLASQTSRSELSFVRGGVLKWNAYSGSVAVDCVVQLIMNAVMGVLVPADRLSTLMHQSVVHQQYMYNH